MRDCFDAGGFLEVVCLAKTGGPIYEGSQRGDDHLPTGTRKALNASVGIPLPSWDGRMRRGHLGAGQSRIVAGIGRRAGGIRQWEVASMGEIVRRAGLGAGVVSVCTLLVVVAVYHVLSTTRPKLRSLREREIQGQLRVLTGHELTCRAEQLQGMLYSFRGEDLFVAFRTDQEGCASMVKAYGDQGAIVEVMTEGQDSLVSWPMTGLRMGCVLQQELGVHLFDPILLDQIGFNHQVTGTVHYIHSSPSSSKTYEVLVVRQGGTVYIFGARARGG